MELMEILNDAIRYPLKNISALIIYIILGIIVALALGGGFLAVLAGMEADNVLAVLGGGAVGFVIALIIGFIITGYELDIIKLGIDRSEEAPSVDFLRQFVNGIKYFVVTVVYMAVPLILIAILGIFFQDWILWVIALVLGIIFGLALMMAECRLAKTEDLTDALAVGMAIGDIGKIGFVKVLAFIILITVVAIIVSFIGGLFGQLDSTVGSIVSGILSVYLTFFFARATGLLYSEI